MVEQARERDSVAKGVNRDEPVGLRDRHKVATRAALQAAALDLFRRHGFHSTTTEMIAEAAEVSERTLFRYFESKDDLLLGEVTAVLAEVRAALARRPAAEPPVVAIREALVEVLLPRDFSLAWLASIDLVDPGRPRFRVRLIRALQSWESDVADLLLAREEAVDGHQAELDPSSVDPCDKGFEAAVIAAATTAALRSVLLRELRSFRGERYHPDADGRLAFEALLRGAFEVLERGCRLSVSPARLGRTPQPTT
jgi:AcrR family transcriptional regulator